MKKIFLIALVLMMPSCAKRHVTVTTTPPPVVIYVDPNTVDLVSGQQQQFTAQVSNTTNTAVTWYSCASGAITATGLFTAPVVTQAGNICVYAISQADPSKSSTSYAMVSPPPPVATCGNPYSKDPYYQLPSFDAQNFIAFVQPADTIYAGTVSKPTTASDPGSKLPRSNAPGEQYCMNFIAQGGKAPYTYSVENPTPGLTMNANTGLYSGTVTQAGVFTNIRICATDSAGSTVCLSPQTHQVCDGVTFCNGFGDPLLPPPPLPTGKP
jgi:hypothetical protein